MKLLNISLVIFFLLGNLYSQQYKVNRYEDYVIKENLMNGAPHRIYNLKQNYLHRGFKQKMTNKEILSLSENIIDDHKSLINIGKDKTKIFKVDTHDNSLSVVLLQTYKNIPILNSGIGYTVNEKGDLLSLGADVYENINLSTSPLISRQQVVANLLDHFENEKLKIIDDIDLYIYPVEEKRDDYKLVWQLTLADSNNFRIYRVLYDALEGRIIKKIDQAMSGGIVSGVMKYQYYPTNHLNAPATCNLANHNILIWDAISQSCGNANTNSDGYFWLNKDLAYGTYYAHAILKNSYVEVRDRNILLLEYLFTSGNTSPTHLVTSCTPQSPPTPFTRIFPTCTATNMFYHVNYAHDYYKNTFAFSSMDYSMISTFDDGLGLNGSADGTNISFGSVDGQLWALSSDIIYHEYSHNVMYKIYGDWIGGSSSTGQGRAMDEGLADFFAGIITNDASIGEAVGLTRTLDNTYIFNSSESAHWNGQVIGGACWDINKALGKATSEQLVFKALRIAPQARNFTDFLENLLIADYMLFNGSNRNAIISAFNNHSIQPDLIVASISGPTSLNANQTGTWSITASGGVSPYTYAWSYYKSCDTDLPVAPCGYWYQLGQTSNTVTRYDTSPFELKCIITDAINQTTSVSKYVSVIGLNKETDLDSSIENIPQSYEVYNNYPNPFNPSTKIRFSLPQSDNVSIVVYNSLGQLVTKLVDDIYPSGFHEVLFNATGLPSGVYFYQVVLGNKSFIKQILLLK
jgi:Zn-dependent metalloprotease